MKKNLLLLFMVTMISSLCAMHSSMESGELTDSSSSLRTETPRHPEWMEEAQKLANELQLFLAESKNMPGYEKEIDEVDETRTIYRDILCNAWNIYQKAIPCSGEKKLNGPCLQGVSNNLDSEALTANKIIAASWLLLIDSEHKDFFKKKMLEWAICAKHKQAVKYLVKKEKIDVTIPNLVGSVPLVLACEVGEMSIVTILLKNGALEGENKKETLSKAIEVAARYNRSTIVETLKQQRVSKNTVRCLLS